MVGLELFIQARAQSASVVETIVKTGAFFHSVVVLYQQNSTILLLFY
jgi:hypothetical protein